jgi:hypothetical protein
MQQVNSNNLNVLRILYIVKAALTFLTALFFVLYAFVGGYFFTFIENMEGANVNEPVPDFVSGVFIVIGAVGAVFCIALGILTLLAAGYIKKRKGYNFIFAMGVVNCLTGLLGLGLGIFTFVELSKPQVKALFESKQQQPIGY